MSLSCSRRCGSEICVWTEQLENPQQVIRCHRKCDVKMAGRTSRLRSDRLRAAQTVTCHTDDPWPWTRPVALSTESENRGHGGSRAPGAISNRCSTEQQAGQQQANKHNIVVRGKMSLSVERRTVKVYWFA